MKSLILSCILLFSACSLFDNNKDGIAPVVTVNSTEGYLSILSKSDTPMIIFVMESNNAAVFDPAPGFPCAFLEPNLQPKEIIQISYSDILGWEEGEESAWFLWTDCNGSENSKTIKL